MTAVYNMQQDILGFSSAIEYIGYGEIGVFRSPLLSRLEGIDHGFSARTGGVSRKPYDTMNLGWNRNDPTQNVTENFKRFCSACGFDYASMTLVNYEHGSNVVRVDQRHRGYGFGGGELEFCDGIVTNDPAVTLVTSHADCSGMFFYDPVNRAIGLVHAGAMGMLGRIGANAVNAMAKHYGSRPDDITAAVMPCICRDCYEVDEAYGERFVREFDDRVAVAGKKGKLQLDLVACGLIQLTDVGLKRENISYMGVCTYEDEKRLFSYRRDKGDTGDMAAYIRLV